MTAGEEKIFNAIMEIKVDVATLKGLHDNQILSTQILSKTQLRHEEKMETHDEEIKNMAANQNRFFGAISVVGLALSAFFGWLFKH